MQASVAKTLGTNREHIRASERVLNDTSAGWTEVKQKRANNAITEEHLKLACDFWATPGNSRPTG